MNDKSFLGLAVVALVLFFAGYYFLLAGGTAAPKKPALAANALAGAGAGNAVDPANADVDPGVCPLSGTGDCPIEKAMAEGTAPPRVVLVKARQYSFEPSVLSLKKGEKTVIMLESVDVEHSLLIPELGLNLRAPVGETAQAEITPDTAGVFGGYCGVYCGGGHGGMALSVKVE